MALLLEGARLGLQPKVDQAKSVVFVKLTDSALRGLEEYLRHRAVLDKNGAAAPTIHFNQAGGAISLPSSSGERSTVFPFGLSASEDGPSKQSSLACVRSGPTASSLESMGTMGETLRVRASEDSAFGKVKAGFQAVKEERGSSGTVMLDDKDKTKKSKSVVRRLPPSASSRPPSTSEPHPRPAHRDASPAARPSPSLNPLHRRPATSPVPAWRSPSAEAPPPPQERPRAKFPTQHKPSKPPTCNPEIMKRSLRERLVHLLAVRAQKKMELHTRIYKDGMREKDKKSNLLSMLLREVAECKSNVYELKRAMWNDVKEDWPFYTAEDRAALKRRKPQNLTPPGSDTGSTSSGHSPSSTNPASPPQIECGIKRNSFSSRFGEEHSASLPPSSKKIRVSSYKRPGESGRPAANSFLASAHVSPRGLQHLHLDTDSSRLDLPNFEQPPGHDDSAPDWAQFHDGEAARQNSPGPLRREEEEPPEERRSPEPGDGGGLVALATNTNKDFIHDFSTIVSAEQRTEFKAVYNESYTKYRALHGVLDAVSRRAATLEEQLRGVSKGSPQFKDVKTRIRDEFQRTRTDPACQEAYSSFQYLHEKLAHIKKLVHEYDQARVAGRR